jgi:phage-related protein
MTEETSLKPVVWMGSGRKDLKRFPDSVQHQVGYAIMSRNAAASIAMPKC